MPPGIQLGGAQIDLSPRYFRTATVAASPAAATITIVATLTINEDLAVMEAVQLWAYGSFTVGTSGVSVLLQIRKTDATGTVLATTGAVTIAAASLGSLSLNGADTSPSLPGQVYVLTATVASAVAASTFSAVHLAALVI